jgi:hypothetical protein
VLHKTLRWVTDQFALLTVLAVLAAAFVYLLVEPGRWGRASGGVGVAVLVAAVLRGVLPATRVGLLAVRSRWLDTATYLVLGGVILAVDIRLHA